MNNRRFVFHAAVFTFVLLLMTAAGFARSASTKSKSASKSTTPDITESSSAQKKMSAKRSRPAAKKAKVRKATRAKVDALAAAGQASWAETLRQAKELGAVDIQACSLSMDLLGLEETDLDPLVDGVEGVTAFYLNAGEGQIVFI